MKKIAWFLLFMLTVYNISQAKTRELTPPKGFIALVQIATVSIKGVEVNVIPASYLKATRRKLVVRDYGLGIGHMFYNKHIVFVRVAFIPAPKGIIPAPKRRKRRYNI